MIAHWKVLECVAERYGGLKDSFEEAQRQLEEMRRKKQTPLDLEDNEERKRLRMAREVNMAVGLERIMGTIDFQDVYIFELLSRLSKSVCRIVKGNRAFGTGFLVADDIILTNHHVIEVPDDAKDMYAEFNYEIAPPPHADLKERSAFRLDASRFFLTSSLIKDPADPHSGLDFTLIGVDPVSISGEALSTFPPVLLDGNQGKIIKGESCIIIQHPDGKPKKVVLKNTAFFSETDSRIVYETDTLPGSSGSMVVALGTCEVIALHHAGLPRTDDQNRILTRAGTIAGPGTPDDEIDWIGNEGIRISRIIKALAEAGLPATMEAKRNQMLGKTKAVLQKITQKGEQEATDNITVVTPVMNDAPSPLNQPADFLITAINSTEAISQIEAVLRIRYGSGFEFYLAMPAAAEEGQIELFVLRATVQQDPQAEIKEILQIPGVLNAEVDVPLALNADTSFTRQSASPVTGTEAGAFIDDGYGEPNEAEFISNYTEKSKSRYVIGKRPEEYRKWNWEATNFDKVLMNATTVSPREKGVRIVQFDTGYSDHPKVLGGFDLDNDYNFLEEEGRGEDARDSGTTGFMKMPGHGTRTGSLLIGNPFANILDDGNSGLLSKFDYKLVPFRIANSVILINRQKQLASALNMAISQGFDIITMSMGLPPTIATAKMAKRAYDKGVIWCCAAGNEVQFVVAPAVYPGTIAIAASNPLDAEWPRSSNGDSVDITAPGQDIYVPILYKDKADGDKVKDGFSYGSGTSYATPHVAAAAAYWLAAYQDILNQSSYSGWKRVEAFRMALKLSARKDNQLPRKGFGRGMLDVQNLLQTPPPPAADLEYAYNNWNENAFFASLQGYAELAKTYWNKFHGWAFGKKRGAQESLITEGAELSLFSRQLEQALFGSASGAFESAGEPDPATTLERLSVVTQLITSSAKK